MYPPDNSFFNQISSFAPQLMFGMLILSFVFLYFKQNRLMFLGLLSTGLIAFYLKKVSNQDMVLPEKNILPKIKIAHLNLSQFSDQKPTFHKYLNNINADIISFQEYTEEWEPQLTQNLYDQYPHAYKVKREDFFGLAVFSNKRLLDIDNFNYEIIPNLRITVDNLIKDIVVFSSYIPENYPHPELNSEDHLNTIAEEISKDNRPIILLGNFHKMYWSGDMINFIKRASLKNSRRSSSIKYLNPEDHIFYSNELECIYFEELEFSKKPIGIIGEYQLSNTN